MKVVAQTAAFYNGQRVRAGSTVEVEDGFKARWAIPVDGAAKSAGKGKGKGKAEPATLSEMGSEPAQSQTEVLA